MSRATTLLARLGLGGVVAAFCIALVSARADAGTTGKLTGVVRDAKQQPLAGVNIALVGVPLGAISDLEGRYTILNVPAGTYSIKASLIGQRTLTMTTPRFCGAPFSAGVFVFFLIRFRPCRTSWLMVGMVSSS